jgi:hypothetical protein
MVGREFSQAEHVRIGCVVLTEKLQPRLVQQHDTSPHTHSIFTLTKKSFTENFCKKKRVYTPW